MLKLAIDENFDGALVHGMRRRMPTADILRIQDAGLLGADDPTIVAWAAAEGRILVSFDRSSLGAFAYERVAQGLPMAGSF